MNSIGKKIIVSMISLVAASLIILGVVFVVLSRSSTEQLVEQTMDETVKIASDRVRWEVKSFVNISSEMGRNNVIYNLSAPDEAKKEVLAETAEEYGFERGNFIDADGNGVDGNTYADREYFKKALEGKTNVSEPLVSNVTGKLTIIISAPVWKNGEAGGTSVGCVYFVPNEEFLNDIIKDVTVSPNSKAYIIDAEGNTIASVNVDDVKNGLNVQKLAAEGDESYKELAEVHQAMENGEEGYREFTQNGVKTVAAISPIENSNGWSMAIIAPKSDFMNSINRTANIGIILMIVMAVIAAAIAVVLGKSIGGRIKACASRLDSLAEGDLSSPVPEVNINDETGMLAKAASNVVNDLNAMIGDIEYILGEMAAGNFNVGSRCGEELYNGDYHSIYASLSNINIRLSDAMSRINISADQVSTGSDQVSGGAQSLAQGAAEQASSIEQLAATIETISSRVQHNTQNCEDGKRLVDQTVECINSANDDMRRLISAMSDISDSANEIGKIIKAIEDIAFQTNILALNAAVEAARAGSAGKGFAVVADEVRNLASKSAAAAKNTTVLIEKAVAAVSNGTAITEQTAASVTQVEDYSGQVKDIVDRIANASHEQAEMISQVTIGIEQISGVVQTNSATSEESAAASEELSGQANSLKDLLGTFKFKK